MEEQKIKYIIKRNSRFVRLRIVIHPDGKVIITAPQRINKKIIDNFIKEKIDWIKEKLDFLKTEGIIDKKSGSRKEFYHYRARAKKLVVDKLKEINKVYNFSYYRVAVRFQKTRWGSCSKQGNLNFNYRIIFLPDHLVNYLIAHELCHLKEMNHSKNFWNLVEKAIPNYRHCARELRKIV